MKFKNDKSKNLHEYERLSTEILQDQKIRITIFTFSITTTALILGFSFNTTLLIETIVAIAAILLPLTLFERYFSTLFDQIFSDRSHWMRTFSRVGVSTMLLFC
jgi:hypothetical protein